MYPHESTLPHMVTSHPTPSTVEQADSGACMHAASASRAAGSAPKTSSLSRPLRSMKIRSSWIASVAYRRVDGVGFLAIFVRGDKGRAPHAMLYGPSPAAPEGVPSWVAGLVQAGVGGVSVGRAYNRIVRGREQEVYGWGYERVEGEEKLSELKEMMR